MTVQTHTLGTAPESEAFFEVVRRILATRQQLDFVETNTPVGTTSGTLEDVTGMMVQLRLPYRAHVLVLSSFEIATQSGAAPSTIGVAINVDGTDHLEHQRYLSGTTDQGLGAIVHFSQDLEAGVHTITLRFRRVSGVATPGINNAALFAIAL